MQGCIQDLNVRKFSCFKFQILTFKNKYIAVSCIFVVVKVFLKRELNCNAVRIMLMQNISL